MNDEETRLRSAVEYHLTKIKSGKSTPGDEAAYGIAYQALVSAGYAMPIKRKYRKR